MAVTGRLIALGTATLLIATLGACASTDVTELTPSPTVPGPGPVGPAPESPPPSAAEQQAAPDQVVGTVVRFTSNRTSVDVTIGEDTPAVRDFLGMLPLEVPFEELNGREKIAYLPRELDHTGSPGSDPENGDLIYYTPWGNLGFYYNADGIDYSESTLHLGTYSATEEQLSLLEGGTVRIELETDRPDR